MKIMRTKNVEEAIQLASKLKSENAYNWFRGQVAFKPPTSTFQRRVVEEDAKEAYFEKLQFFLAWLNKTPLLTHLQENENVDQLFAILQHYGFPTCYIDFTTEPSIAGFFASDCKEPPKENEQSVIYCLNTEKLMRFYNQLQNAKVMLDCKVEVLSFDVSNLWRLQAQHGHFLYTNHDWTKLYEMDCIVFPWTGLPSFPNRSEVYPEHKSSLEQLLDQYFFSEKSYQGMKRLRELKNDNGERVSIHFVQAKGFVNGYDVNFFTKKLVKLDSWQEPKVHGWSKQEVENFHRVTGKAKKIKFRNDVKAPSISEQIFVGIQSALRLDKLLRGYAVNWEFEGFSKEFCSDRYCNLVRQAWNGMRTLPFTNEDIAYTFSELFKLCSIHNCDSFQGHLVEQSFNNWISDSFEIEIANFNESRSRAYCSEKSLLALIDHKWKGSLREKGAGVSLTRALQITNMPNLIFDFDGLAQLFSREIIPSQLARGRELILYNPAHIETLGLP